MKGRDTITNFEQWMRSLSRPANKMIISSEGVSNDNYQSWFGRITLSAPGESWPIEAGRPMWPLLQIVIRDLPHLPTSIQDLALIRAYVNPSYTCETDNRGASFFHPESASGRAWLIRVSASLSNLVRIDEPNHGSPIQPTRIGWEMIPEDYPAWDDLPADTPDSRQREYSEFCESHDLTLQGTKVGGWPFLAQGEICWGPMNQHPHNPEYVFQIDSDYDRGWSWRGSGLAYFGRGTGLHRDQWAMQWQGY